MSVLTPHEDAADLRAVVRRTRTTGRARALAVGLVLAALTLTGLCLSVSLGRLPVPLTEVLAVLAGQDRGPYSLIVLDLRLPRALVAVLVGGALGLAGALFQSLARNPLASPDVIGVTTGASAAAVAVIVGVGAAGLVLPAAALVGAVLTGGLVYLLAAGPSLSVYRLVLVGIGVSAVLSAITTLMLTRADLDDARASVVWLTGSLSGRTWEQVWPLTIALALLLPLCAWVSRPLRVLQLDDDLAAGVGVAVRPVRLVLLLVGVLLTAVATAAAGPVPFVALVAPAIARRLARTPLTLLPSALTGALLMVACDLVGRYALAPTTLPVGVVTGLVGAPYLLWLLSRASRVGTEG